MAIHFQRRLFHDHHAVGLYAVGLIVDRRKHRYAFLTDKIGFSEIDGKIDNLVIHRERYRVTELRQSGRVNTTVEEDRGVLDFIDEVLLEFRVVLDTALAAHYLYLHFLRSDGSDGALARHNETVAGIQSARLEVGNSLFHVDALYIAKDLTVGRDIHRERDIVGI